MLVIYPTSIAKIIKCGQVAIIIILLYKAYLTSMTGRTSGSYSTAHAQNTYLKEGVWQLKSQKTAVNFLACRQKIGTSIK